MFLPASRCIVSLVGCEQPTAGITAWGCSRPSVSFISRSDMFITPVMGGPWGAGLDWMVVVGGAGALPPPGSLHDG